MTTHVQALLQKDVLKT